MANTKTPYYAMIGTAAALVLQLDPDIYTAQVQTATGLTSTKPANTVKLLPTNIRYALASGQIVSVKKKITKGTGEEQKVRSYSFLAEVAKADTAGSDLTGKVIKVGNGAGVDWTVA
jgi:uncharacterized membrane-anchored protein